MRGSPDPSDPAAPARPRGRRLVLAGRGVLVVLALGVAVFGIGLIGYRIFADDDGSASDAENDGDFAGDGSSADDAIGPEPGIDVDAYVDERAAALASAEGERVAIVSFADYVDENAARERLADVDIGVLYVAFPGNEPAATSDLAALRADLTAEAEEQLPELRSILPTVEDPEFAEFYAEEIERYEQILAGGSVPEVAFGAIVRADAAVLRDVAAADWSRLVDVGDAGVLTRDAALRGLRPEETTTAGEPPVRPATVEDE